MDSVSNFSNWCDRLNQLELDTHGQAQARIPNDARAQKHIEELVEDGLAWLQNLDSLSPNKQQELFQGGRRLALLARENQGPSNAQLEDKLHRLRSIVSQLDPYGEPPAHPLPSAPPREAPALGGHRKPVAGKQTSQYRRSAKALLSSYFKLPKLRLDSLLSNLSMWKSGRQISRLRVRSKSLVSRSEVQQRIGALNQAIGQKDASEVQKQLRSVDNLIANTKITRGKDRPKIIRELCEVLLPQMLLCDPQEVGQLRLPALLRELPAESEGWAKEHLCKAMASMLASLDADDETIARLRAAKVAVRQLELSQSLESQLIQTLDDFVNQLPHDVRPEVEAQVQKYRAS